MGSPVFTFYMKYSIHYLFFLDYYLSLQIASSIIGNP